MGLGSARLGMAPVVDTAVPVLAILPPALVVVRAAEISGPVHAGPVRFPAVHQPPNIALGRSGGATSIRAAERLDRRRVAAQRASSGVLHSRLR